MCVLGLVAAGVIGAAIDISKGNMAGPAGKPTVGTGVGTACSVACGRGWWVGSVVVCRVISNSAIGSGTGGVWVGQIIGYAPGGCQTTWGPEEGCP